ncbi:MAG: hypothetical protein ACP5SI_05975 [Chloroflexia bacterium]
MSAHPSHPGRSPLRRARCIPLLFALLACCACSRMERVRTPTLWPTPTACSSWLYTPQSLKEARDVREAAFCFAAAYCRVLMESPDACYDLCFALKRIVVQPLTPQELRRALQEIIVQDRACDGQLRPALDAPLRGLWERLGEYEGEK